MKKPLAALLGVLIFSATFSYVATPAFALGGCGPNRHRSSVTGKCIWGGQNQAWCLRKTGHKAVQKPNGEWVCIR